MLTHSPLVKKNHLNYVFSTDLESDDLVAELQFAEFLKELANKEAKQQINVAFLVGEGYSAIKVARQEKMIASLKEAGFLQHKNLHLQVIRGYNDFTGSQKSFLADGQECLSEEEIATTLEKAAEVKNEQVQITAQQQLTEFLEKHPNTAIINIKPPRELLDIAKTAAGKELLAGHCYYGTGSYNHRATIDPKKKAENQQELLSLLNSFKETFLFETYSAHESNSLSMNNTPALFSLLDDAKPGEPLYYLAHFIDAWGEYLLAEDRQSLPKHLTVLQKAGQLDEKQVQALHALFKGQRADITTEQFAGHKAFLKQLSDKLGKIESPNEEQKAALASSQKLDRLLGKWSNITESRRQFVNADPAWTSIIFGQCQPASYHLAKTQLDFNGDYTILKESKDSRVHICLPGQLSVTEYNDMRKPKEKPAALKEAQAALFVEIQQHILATVKNIHDATKSAKLASAASSSLSSDQRLFKAKKEETPALSPALERIAGHCLS